MATYIFHIHGMHCPACALYIEDEARHIEGVIAAHVNLHKTTLHIEAHDSLPAVTMMSILAQRIKGRGYSLHETPHGKSKTWGDFLYAIPIAFMILLGIVFLQKIGLVNFITAGTVNYPAAFMIGLVASVSTCLAVVGGLLLSVSASYEKASHTLVPQIAFHSGRLISFFLLGGVIGLIGSAFTLNITMTVMLSVFVGIVMVILGINLIDVFPWARKLQFHTPHIILRHVKSFHMLEYDIAPFIIGVATFFLPCGFTQSMQIYALGTGSFLTGAFTMLVFALGTFPVLALISFTSFKFGQGKYASIFFKTAGIMVLLFAFVTILNGLAAGGIIPPLLSL